jgi:hypothetical protein
MTVGCESNWHTSCKNKFGSLGTGFWMGPIMKIAEEREFAIMSRHPRQEAGINERCY